MSSISVWKQIGLCGLVGFATFSLTFLILNQWHCDLLKQRMQSSSGAECFLENTNDTDDASISSEIDRLVEMDRAMVRIDMMDYPYPGGKYNISATKIEDLLIEEYGVPIKSIILTTWRSGSTFLGDILREHPGNFYFFEPLSDFTTVKVRGPPLAQKALDRIRALFNCQYADLQDDLINYAKNHPFILNRTSYLWERCMANSSICYDHRYLSAMCKLFPFQSMKLIRLRLNLAEELLADEKLAIRLVLMVRDPRGIVRSRKHVEFCQRGPDCSEPALLCADLVADYKTAVELRKKYPNTFRVIRYEDLAGDPYKQVEELFKFYGRDFHPKVEKFLDTHTTADVGGSFSSSRDSKATPFRWKMALDFQEVEEIQRTCAAAMEYWGYVPAMNATHQREFDPVTDYSLN